LTAHPALSASMVSIYLSASSKKSITNFFSSVTTLCILELSTLTRVERAVKNTTIIVIYRVLVYIQMSQPTKCFGLF